MWTILPEHDIFTQPKKHGPFIQEGSSIWKNMLLLPADVGMISWYLSVCLCENVCLCVNESVCVFRL